jgi:hypothetical protein
LLEFLKKKPQKNPDYAAGKAKNASRGILDKNDITEA